MKNFVSFCRISLVLLMYDCTKFRFQISMLLALIVSQVEFILIKMEKRFVFYLLQLLYISGLMNRWSQLVGTRVVSVGLLHSGGLTQNHFYETICLTLIGFQPLWCEAFLLYRNNLDELFLQENISLTICVYTG